ncbi:MAG: hypothetical protein WAM85_10585 [Terracidiphilus sp.]
MIRAVAFALLIPVAMPAALAAQTVSATQTPPKSELSFGYSYLFRDYRHTQLNPVSGGMNGWNAAYGRPRFFSEHFGFTADFSGYYATGGFFTPQIYFLTAGPRFSLPVGRSIITVHVLGGAMIASSDVIAQTSSHVVPMFGVGGGFEFPAGRRWAWQADCDWQLGGFGSNDTNQISQIVKSNARLSVGPVLRF